jgi:protein-S-isoprenylcysteine O-methyltransferase Ste14
MNFHQLIFWVLWSAWIMMEIVVNLRARRLRQKEAVRSVKVDRGSVWFIYIGMYVLIATTFLLSMYRLGIMPKWVPYIGNCVMVFGLFMRYSAITQLGRFFSTTIQVTDNQTVVSSGWYRYIRHPAYTGGWIIAVGVGLELNTWIGTLIIAVGLWAIYYHRIRVEEEELVARLGSPYEEYCRKSWRMFWGIW